MVLLCRSARKCAVFLFASVILAPSLYGAIPVGPFCGDLTQAATQQTGSLTENGIAASCSSSKACPGTVAGNVAYTAFTFTNDTGVDTCVAVSGTSPCASGGSTTFAAYQGSFDPNNICTNYLGDSGDTIVGGQTTGFGFKIANGGTFVIVASGGSGGCGNFCFTLNPVACSITCPDNITVGTGTSTQCGANVPFDVSSVCGAATSCTTNGIPISSGDFFPVGTTTTTCSDGASQCSFGVTVNDNTVPQVTCPAEITATPPPNQCSLPASYAVPTATDNCTSSVVVSCSPPSGSTFTVGNTPVTCTATDDATNQSQCQFNVHVQETTPPTITCPANVTVSASQDSCSASPPIAAPIASDTCGPTTITCTPTPGGSFPVGESTVTCTATDPSQNTAQCTFNVDVNDTQPPSITCPGNVTAQTFGTGTTVNYSPPTVDDNCLGATVQCLSPSGSTFPLGDTPVTCTATDANQNTSQCTFAVSVEQANPNVPTLDPRALAALAVALAGIGALLVAWRR